MIHIQERVHTQKLFKRWLVVGLLLWLTLVLSMRTTAASMPLTSAHITNEVEQQLASTGSARVLILLDEPVVAAALRQAAIADVQASVLNTLTSDEFQLYRQYQTLPGLAGELSAAGLAKLQLHPLVRAIQVDHPGQAHLQQSLPALGANLVHTTYNITGRGVTVAVLDSGIDTDHPDLASDLVAQHCFTNGNCSPSNTDESNSAEDANGHGTHVAGVITADGAVSGKGFAPDAEIVAVRVLDAGGSGFISDWVAGLDWVTANLATNPVQLVNLSLGTFALYTGNCDAQEPMLAAAVAQLRSQGITLFASSGNQGASNRIAAPACNSGVIAVGATYDGNVGRQPSAGTYQSSFGASWPACADTPTSLQTVTCFTNSNAQLDLLAPGAPILAPYLGGSTATFWGTSQASPTAAGIAALLLEAKPELTPDQIETILEASGPTVVDPKNNLSFPQINAKTAVESILPAAPTDLTITGPTSGPVGASATFTATLTPLTVTLPVTYTWQATDLADQIQSGGPTNAITLTWSTPGTKVITVTALNESGTINATQPYTVVAVAPADVQLTAPLTASLGVTQTLLAAVQPLSTTTPITYVWAISDRAPVTQTGGITDSLAVAWTTPGSYTVTVTAFNALGVVSTTQPVNVQGVAPQTLTLTSAPTTTIGVAIPVLAQVQPISASLPITYSWQATQQTPVTRSGGPSDTLIFSWTTSGTVTVTVQAQNSYGTVQSQRTIQVLDHHLLYLPVVIQP